MDQIYPTEADLEIRAQALGDAALLVSRIVEHGASTDWAAEQTARVSRRLERYLREGS